MDSGFDIPQIEPYVSALDEIQSVIESMNPKPQHYIYGDADYIINEIIQRSKSVSSRQKLFPLIALVDDFEENEDSEITINLVIANSTDKSWNNDQRKLKSFTTVLDPLYLSFFKSLRQSIRIESRFDYPHSRTDLYSLGRKALLTKTIQSNQYVDAIEIRNLKLKIIKY